MRQRLANQLSATSRCLLLLTSSAVEIGATRRPASPGHAALPPRNVPGRRPRTPSRYPASPYRPPTPGDHTEGARAACCPVRLARTQAARAGDIRARGAAGVIGPPRLRVDGRGVAVPVLDEVGAAYEPIIAGPLQARNPATPRRIGPAPERCRRRRSRPQGTRRTGRHARSRAEAAAGTSVLVTSVAVVDSNVDSNVGCTNGTSGSGQVSSPGSCSALPSRRRWLRSHATCYHLRSGHAWCSNPVSSAGFPDQSRRAGRRVRRCGAISRVAFAQARTTGSAWGQSGP